MREWLSLLLWKQVFVIWKEMSDAKIKDQKRIETGRERILYLDAPLLQSPRATDSIQSNNSLRNNNDNTQNTT